MGWAGKLRGKVGKIERGRNGMGWKEDRAWVVGIGVLTVACLRNGIIKQNIVYIRIHSYHRITHVLQWSTFPIPKIAR